MSSSIFFNLAPAGKTSANIYEASAYVNASEADSLDLLKLIFDQGVDMSFETLATLNFWSSVNVKQNYGTGLQILFLGLDFSLVEGFFNERLEVDFRSKYPVDELTNYDKEEGDASNVLEEHHGRVKGLFNYLCCVTWLHLHFNQAVVVIV